MRSERLYLIDIVQATDDIERFLGATEESDFYADDILKTAIVHKLMLIGEAASKISRGLKARYPIVKWKSVLGFRNIVVHEYFAVDWKVVWATAKISAPEIQEQIISILEAEYPDYKKALKSK